MNCFISLMKIIVASSIRSYCFLLIQQQESKGRIERQSLFLCLLLSFHYFLFVILAVDCNRSLVFFLYLELLNVNIKKNLRWKAQFRKLKYASFSFGRKPFFSSSSIHVNSKHMWYVLLWIYEPTTSKTFFFLFQWEELADLSTCRPICVFFAARY